MDKPAIKKQKATKLKYNNFDRRFKDLGPVPRLLTDNPNQRRWHKNNEKQKLSEFQQLINKETLIQLSQ